MAFFLLQGKGANLIAGYNTMSPEEQAKINEVALAKALGKLLVAIIICLYLFPLSDYLGYEGLQYVGIAVIAGLTITSIIYVNTHSRFKR